MTNSATPQLDGDNLNLDFTGITTDFAPMPIGIYRIRLNEKPTVEPSKKSGENQVNFVFEVIEPEFEGRKLFMHCSLQPQALWKLRKALNGLGVETPDGPIQLNLADLIGREALASVTQDEYQGKMKNQLDELLPLDGSVDYPGAASVTAPF